jgi:uncharacterized SAM-binding protein YcdF (DUF218 family)
MTVRLGQRARRAAPFMALFVLLVWATSVFGVLVLGRADERRPSDAIIVLGAAQYVGHPSPVLGARLDHAEELWRAHVAHFVVLTGGVGKGDTTSEAEVGRRYLIAHGIPDSVILLERGGRTTGQSIRAATAILKQRGLSSAVLVSDPFHAMRLRILAFRHGLRAVTSPTRTSPIGRNAQQELRYVLAESFKLPIAALFPDQ